MRTFEVNAQVTISITAYVCASSEEEAVEKAGSLPMPNFCHMCSKMGTDPDDECWNVGDLDGEPTNMFAEEA